MKNRTIYTVVETAQIRPRREENEPWTLAHINVVNFSKRKDAKNFFLKRIHDLRNPDFPAKTEYFEGDVFCREDANSLTDIQLTKTIYYE